MERCATDAEVVADLILLTVEEQAALHEKYAHSLRTIRRLGECALSDDVESEEQRAAREMLLTDFKTGVAEMLSTDEEFKEQLDINPENTYGIEAGQVIMKNGKPISGMIRIGMFNSQEAARKDKRMWSQAERDAADYDNAVAVDEMPAGHSRIVGSMDPKEAMDRDGEEFWANKLGYRRGLAFIQWYHKVDEETLVAGSLSVDMSDQKTWSQVFAEEGIDIPSDTPCNEWIRHAIQGKMTLEQTKQRVNALRRRYYELKGRTGERLSVTALVEEKEKGLIDGMFNDLYVPLAIAAHTEKKTPEMHDLATALLQNAASFSAEMRRELLRITNSEVFDDNAARVMEFMIRYGTVEELRKRLPGHLRRTDTLTPVIHAFQETQSVMPSPAFDPQMAAMLIASNVSAGATAGRSYGGCAAGFELSAQDATDDNRRQTEGSLNSQGAYGGRDGSSAESSSSEVCDIETQNCYCCIYNSDGSPRKRPLTVTAVIDAEKTIHCQRLGCGAYLTQGGQSKFIGYIAERGRARAAKAKQGAKA